MSSVSESNGGKIFGAKFAVRLRHDELVDARQGLVLVVVPELFDIGLEAFVEHDLSGVFQMHPAGLHLHLLVARDHAVIRLHDRGDFELARENLLARAVEGVYAISGRRWRAVRFR